MENTQAPKNTLTEGNLTGNAGNGNSFRFKLNGVRKSILGGPLTGAKLHAIAGNPDHLSMSGGGDVPNDDKEFKLNGDDTEFVSKPGTGKALDKAAAVAAGIKTDEPKKADEPKKTEEAVNRGVNNS